MLWKMALQFLVKQWKRNLLVASTIAVSVFVMVLLSGLLVGIKDKFLNENVRQGGHVRIHASGWSQRDDQYELGPVLPDTSALLTQLRAMPEVESAETFLPFGALLLSGEKNLPVEADGVQANSVISWPASQHMVSGDFHLDASHIVISRGLAHLLDWKEHTPLVILTEDNQSMPAYHEFQVAGVFDTGNPGFDETHVFIDQASAASLINLEGSSLEIRVTLKQAENSAALRTAILADKDNQGLEIQTWQEYQGSFLIFLKLFDVFMLGINLLLTIVAVAVITNAILMNFLERLPVISTLRAIGMKRRESLGLVLREGSLLGIIGSCAGLGLGLAVLAPFLKTGLEMGDIAAAFNMGGTIPIALSGQALVQSLIAGIATALAGSLYAGLTGAKTPILDGLSEE